MKSPRALVQALMLLATAAALASCGFGASTQQVAARMRRNFAAADYRAAAIDLRNLVRVQPKHPEWHLLLAQAALHTGLFGQAIDEFRAAQQLGVPQSTIVPGLAEALLDEGHPQQAFDQISGFAETPASEAMLRSLRGRALSSLRRYDEARAELSRALEVNPSDVRARIALATDLIATNELTGAKAELSQALGASPDNFSAHMVLGDWYRRSRQPQEAHREFLRALQLATRPVRRDDARASDELAALLELADSELALGDLESAKQRAARAVKLAPTLEATLLLRARIALQEKRLDDAQTELLELLSRDPDNEQAEALLGVVFAATGKLGQAEMHLASALYRDPHDIVIRRLLAKVLLEEHRPEQALKLASEPDAAVDSELLALAGRASALIGDLSGAIQYLESSEQAAPQDKVRALDVAGAFLAAHRAPEAIGLLRGLSVPESLENQRERLLLEALQSKPREVRVEAHRFAQAHPRDEQALLIAARALSHVGEISDAREMIYKAGTLDERSPRPWLARGVLEWSQMDLTAAGDAFQHALHIDPRNLNALLGEAQVAYATGDLGAATDYLNRACQLSANSLPPRIALARLYLLQGLTAQAEGPIAEARRIAPTDVEVELVGAAAALAQGNFSEAISTLEGLTTRVPRSAGLRTELARAFALARRPDAARAALAEALKVDPTYWPAIALQTSLALNASDPKTTELSLDRLRASKAPRTVVLTSAGDIALKKADLKSALSSYEQAAAVHPTADLVLKIAAVRRALRAANADAPLRAWLQRTPGDWRVRLALAQSLDSQGHQSEAALEYERVLGNSPQQVIALNNLAWIRLQATQLPAGLDLARRAYVLAPQMPSIADTYGWALVQNGDSKEALKVLSDAFRANPSNIVARFHLAVAELKTGRRSEARQNLNTVIASHTDGPEDAQARELVSEIDKSTQKPFDREEEPSKQPTKVSETD